MADSFASQRRTYLPLPWDRESRRPARGRRPWGRAVLFSSALSLLFVFVYGGCNAVAARAKDVGTCFFPWETRIPFFPALIVPYMSIDLFFIASFLLCRDTIELSAHGRRIAAAILIAGATFLAFPLTTGYPRPEVNGWEGRLFRLLWSFDEPHNLVPSLHVALASLLWPLYVRHTQAGLRWLVHAWFLLIVASPLLTLQHHMLDVATGALLGQACIYAFPERRDQPLVRSASANLRVARFYAGGSAVFGILAIAFGSWCWLLLWPAASLALIAIAYARGSSTVFRKTGGRLPLSTRIVLGPYLCGMMLRTLIGRRRAVEPWFLAAPGVYYGGLLKEGEAVALRAMGITGVLDMTAEHAEAPGLLKLDYLNVPVLDLTQPSREQLERAVAFIAEHARRGGVYVHCALGISRSVAAVAAHLTSKQPNRNPTLQKLLARQESATGG